MNRRGVGLFLAVVVAGGVWCGAVRGDGLLATFQGHYYDVLTLDDGTTFDQAAALAASQVYVGLGDIYYYGHLGTITWAGEDAFVRTILPVYSGVRERVRLGGYQPAGSPEPDGGWTWITGETWSYTNWYPGEPNDEGGEDTLAIFIEGSAQYGYWNDESGTVWHSGYPCRYALVEYEPTYVANHDFPKGSGLGDLGWSFTSATGTGGAEVITDPVDASNGLLRLFDEASTGVLVVVSQDVDMSEDGVGIRFAYRFLTDGKISVQIDGAEIDQVPSPATGAGSPGSTEMGYYEEWFDLASLGLAPGEHTLGLALSNAGDPEAYLDNVQVALLPEPGTLVLLAPAAAWALGRRRRRSGA